ncbi:MAG TPA: hypothetical protein VMI12_04340 [Puia sp.]|nr:hypothetical protein [Puia sp.]
MQLHQRINLLVELGKYLVSENDSWKIAKQKAFAENGWFTDEFINLAASNIAAEFLEKNKLEAWIGNYEFPQENPHPKNIGLIMAGNIPLVGFHDFLSIFISGNKQTIKPSSKDNILIKDLVQQLQILEPASHDYISFAEMLKGCDGYIATGSNNSARYFEYYFGKYPNLIRRNRTSVAILEGNESTTDLEKLADDVYVYFGLGCRNVTKLFVPVQYDFIPLLNAFSKYNYLGDYHKYKNNYDYQLALQILNKKYYMTNGSVILTEDSSSFSPISVLHFEYYNNASDLSSFLHDNEDIQCVVGKTNIPFGQSQKPRLADYADGTDTLQFLQKLGETV